MRYDDEKRPKSIGADASALQVSGSPLPCVTLIRPMESEVIVARWSRIVAYLRDPCNNGHPCERCNVLAKQPGAGSRVSTRTSRALGSAITPPGLGRLTHFFPHGSRTPRRRFCVTSNIRDRSRSERCASLSPAVGDLFEENK